MTSAGHFLVACAGDRVAAAGKGTTSAGVVRVTLLRGSTKDRTTCDATNRVLPAADSPLDGLVGRLAVIKAVPTCDGGVERAVLEVLRLQLRGADPRVVGDLIRGHRTYLRPGGPAAWIRCLRRLQRDLPQCTGDLERLAVHAMTCL